MCEPQRKAAEMGTAHS